MCDVYDWDYVIRKGGFTMNSKLLKLIVKSIKNYRSALEWKKNASDVEIHFSAAKEIECELEKLEMIYKVLICLNHKEDAEKMLAILEKRNIHF